MATRTRTLCKIHATSDVARMVETPTVAESDDGLNTNLPEVERDELVARASNRIYACRAAEVAEWLARF